MIQFHGICNFSSLQLLLILVSCNALLLLKEGQDQLQRDIHFRYSHKNMVDDSDHQFMAVAFAVGFATISLVASLLTLYLIKRLKKWNGYIQLVVSLTVCQIIYDISFFFLPVSPTWGQYLYVFLNTLGGLTSSLWSNVIILVTARIVIRLRTVDTLKKVSYIVDCKLLHM